MMAETKQYVNGHLVSPVENPDPVPKLGSATSPQQSTPPYGVDKSSPLEYNDGTLESLGDVLDGIRKIRDTGAIKVADPTAKGELDNLPTVLQHMWDGAPGISSVEITAAFVTS